MKSFLVAALAFSALGAVVEGSSFNSLIGLDGLIPAQFQSRSTDTLGQLRELLGDARIASSIYENYRRMFNKNGENRLALFANSLLEIAEHNVRFAAGLETYDQGVNRFTDMTEEEFFSQYTGVSIPETSEPFPTLTSFKVMDAPSESLNWTAEGITGPIKDQQTCGSCVTFATAGVIESAVAKSRGGPILDLSEQELLDCTKENNGCSGGWYDYSFPPVKNYGLASEEDYPYVNKQNRKGWFGGADCRRNKYARAITTISNWGTCQPEEGNEDNLKSAVANFGPVAVAVAASQSWSRYKSGIYSGNCESSINHAVIVSGYGADKGKEYWIIRNSWGTAWGEAGYMKLPRNFPNKCLVANHCYYAEA